MKERLKRMKFMNKPFTSLIIAGLGTMLAPVSAHAGGIAFDGKLPAPSTARQTGNSKIVKTHRMSDKEIEEGGKGQ
jgi:hypothetical protein